MDSVKVSSASLMNYGLSLTELSTALQCLVAVMTIVYLAYKINNMSMLSAYIKKKVKKHGAKAFIMKVIDMIVKATPSKKDDEMVAKIKKAMNELN